MSDRKPLFVVDPFTAKIRARSKWESRRTQGGELKCYLCHRRPPTEGDVCEACLWAQNQWEGPSLLTLYMSLPEAYEAEVLSRYPGRTLKRALLKLAHDEGWGICECGQLAALNRRHNHHGLNTMLVRGVAEDEAMLSPLPPLEEGE
jgi:hypothetical protein